MSDNENVINPTKNKLWTIFSSIIKSIIVLLIIGIIMFYLSLWVGEEIYRKDTSNCYPTGGWGFREDLNPIYGVVGIIIYIAINYFSFLLYNYITNKFKNYKATLGIVMYIIFSIFINILMLVMFNGFFGSCSFENNLLEVLNTIIVKFGYRTFPTMFVIIYTWKKRLLFTANQHKSVNS